jgi:fructose-1,6-bisphosphatase/inositol monophosphatase family enzyme
MMVRALVFLFALSHNLRYLSPEGGCAMQSINPRLETMKLAARAAGDAILAVRKSNGSITEGWKKTDGSLVTQADKDASMVIRRAILEDFPDDFVICEEDDVSHTAPRPSAFWLSDPLDGTRAFAEGSDDYCVIIAYIVDNHPEIGVIYFPSSNRILFGSSGGGAWMQESNGLPTSLSHNGCDLLAHARMTSSNGPKSQVLYQMIAESLGVASRRGVYSYGNQSGSIMTGIADIVITRIGGLSVWDVAASACILGEMNGVLRDLRGEPIDYMSEVKLPYGVIAACSEALLHQALDKLPPLEQCRF